MTTLDTIRELVAQVRGQGKDVVWLADHVLLVAQHAGGLDLTDTILGDDAADFRRLFRPLLARVSKVAAEESGAAFDPYHGRYTLTRAGRGGLTRLEIVITNTAGVRRLQITPSPVAVRGPAADPTPPPTHVVPPQMPA